LLAGLIMQARPILPGRDLGGAIDWLYTLDSRLRPGAVILIAENESSLFADTFGPPLRYVFDHPVVPLRAAAIRRSTWSPRFSPARRARAGRCSSSPSNRLPSQCETASP
jgi:hypothetical protein